MYGDLAKIGIAFQNSFGTPITTANSFHPVPFLSESVSVEKPPIVIGNMRGTFDEGPIKEGLTNVAGDIDCEAHPITLGALLKAVLGGPTSTKVSSASVYNHVYLPSSLDWGSFAAFPPFTLNKDFGDSSSSDQFSDLQGTKLQLSIANGELLKAKLSILGGKHAQVAAVSLTQPDTSRAWTWDVASVSIGGSANADAVALTVTIDNALANKYTLNGTKTPAKTKRGGRRTVAVEGTMLFESKAEYQNFLNYTAQNFKLTLAGGIISSGYTDTLAIELPQFTYDEFKPVAGGTGQIEVPVKGRGTFDIGSGHAAKVTLTNTKAAY